jgi:hypothetical protein
MDKYSGGVMGKSRQTIDLESDPDQQLRRISRNEVARRLISQGRVRENRHGFICGHVAPSEAHQGKNQSD